jgi:hypothetical protein
MMPGLLRERTGIGPSGAGLDGLGLAGTPVAAQVGDHDLEPCRSQRWHLMPPHPAGVGKPVQQHDRAPLPRDLVLDAGPSASTRPIRPPQVLMAGSPAMWCPGPVIIAAAGPADTSPGTSLCRGGHHCHGIGDAATQGIRFHPAALAMRSACAPAIP